MEESGKRIVSTYDLFPIIRESLSNGQKVKFTVSGNSMLPWIAHNRDQVLLATIHDKQLQIGDIILFQDTSKKYILHRIYKKEKVGYRTIGDACLSDDGLVLPDQIIGIVEKIYQKDRVIDCDSFFWTTVFLIWRKLLPIRKYILKIYFILKKLKKHVKIKLKHDGV